MIKWNKKFTYPKSVRSSVDGKRIYEVGDEKLPSVTTILGQTQSDEKRESLAKWIAKKGEERGKSCQEVRQLEEALQCTVLSEHHVNGNNILDHDRDGSGSASNGCM